MKKQNQKLTKTEKILTLAGVIGTVTAAAAFAMARSRKKRKHIADIIYADLEDSGIPKA